MFVEYISRQCKENCSVERMIRMSFAVQSLPDIIRDDCLECVVSYLDFKALCIASRVNKEFLALRTSIQISKTNKEGFEQYLREQRYRAISQRKRDEQEYTEEQER